jgi:hypothetical protein
MLDAGVDLRDVRVLVRVRVRCRRGGERTRQAVDRVLDGATSADGLATADGTD